jgi:hypothetical protein
MADEIRENKAAPTKMVHFLAELVTELPVRGKVISVEVEDAGYLVKLALPSRGLTVHQLSAYDVSRSMRGDQAALAALRADLMRDLEQSA